MTVAAAALRRRFPSVIADAFLETRLGQALALDLRHARLALRREGLHQLHLPGDLSASPSRRTEQ